MNAVLTEQLVAVAQAARRARQGGKGAIYEAACRDLRMAKTTLLKKLKEVAVTPPRKQRSDAGKTALSREEAVMISALLMESTRKQGKRLYSVADAVTVLRANDKIKAEYVDQTTGEIRPLSETTIHRALRVYGLHPEQLLAPAPVTELASEHPNHVWQIDASLCVLYYLKPEANQQASGLQVMDHAVFYKNKPKNVERIAADRVWSYEITDHASGWIYVEYVMGAESGENLCTVLINAMQERAGADMLHGVPRILNMDPGSAGTASMTRNLCRSLGIDIVVHKAGNARATGQVENARNIIERKFEPGLKLKRVRDLADLNARAAAWRAMFNATAKHKRHGKSRSSVWMTITPAQLLKAPSVEVCRELAVAQPESRKVSPKLRVSFQGREYDVSTVPGVMVGEKLMVTRNPWRSDAAQVVLIADDGHEVFHVVGEVEKNELGFAIGAPRIGESYKRHGDTPAQMALKEIEQLVTSTTSQTEAEAARKGKCLPFGGEIDPEKHINEAQLPNYLPRRGRSHDLSAPRVAFAPLTHVEAAKLIKARVGDAWTAATYQWLAQRFPEGVPQDQIDGIVADLSGAAAHLKRPLTAIAGGAAC